MYLQNSYPVILLAATSAYIIIYAKKEQLNPEKSVIYGIQEDTEYTFEDVSDSISKSQIAVLVIMAVRIWNTYLRLSKRLVFLRKMSGLFIFINSLWACKWLWTKQDCKRNLAMEQKGIVVGCLIIGIARVQSKLYK